MRSFTLVELLIAIVILLFIGSVITTIVVRAMSTWEATERRMLLTHRADVILTRFSDDILSLHLGSGYPYRHKIHPILRYDYTFDGEGNPLDTRLVFIRTFPIEENLLAQEAGSMLGASKRIDGIEDPFEAFEGELMSTSGLCEVAYIFKGEPDFALYRAINSPPGGETSFLYERNLTVDERFRRLSPSVLLFALQFWTPYTDAWDSHHPPLLFKKPDEKSGPLLWWDSTRSMKSPFDEEPDFREYRLYAGPASANDPSDDVFPRAIRVVLIIAEDGGDGIVTHLSRSATSESRKLYVEEAFKIPDGVRYIKVGSEWVEVEKIEEEKVSIKEGGRGLFGTVASEHYAGEPVRAGRVFCRVVVLPGSVDDWSKQGFRNE